METEILIQDLPDEVLIKIFAHLSPKLLKVSALVCSRWNSVISQTPELMAAFRLNLVPGIHKLQTSPTLRRIQCLRTNSLSSRVQEILSLYNLRELELTTIVVTTNAFRQTIVELKLLERLRLENVKFSTEVTEIVPLKLNRLKHLVIDMSDALIPGLISTSSLEVCTIKSSLIVEKNSRLLVSLLRNQPSLVHLELYAGAADTLLSCGELLEFPFKLKLFKIGRTSLHNLYDQLQTFLGAHKDTLLDLTIENSLPATFQVFMFKTLTRLKVLNAPINQRLKFLQTQSSETPKEPFPFVEKFTATNQTQPCLMKSMRSLTAVDMSSINDQHRSSWICSGVLYQLSRLKELRVTEFFLLFPAKFPLLETLVIHRPVPEKFFENFLRSHSESLEKLIIGWIDADAFSRGTLMDSIKRCRKLKYISVTCDSPIVIRSFKNISWPHPWTLEAKFRSLRKSETVEARVIFRFPDDEALWKGECHTWDDGLARELDTFDNYGLNAYVNQFR